MGRGSEEGLNCGGGGWGGVELWCRGEIGMESRKMLQLRHESRNTHEASAKLVHGTDHFIGRSRYFVLGIR
eukprot:3892826-Prymnesium_polylepis.1